MVDVALVGGGLYLSVMRAFLAEFMRMGCVAPDARVVEINGPIGRMRQQLCVWLLDPLCQSGPTGSGGRP